MAKYRVNNEANPNFLANCKDFDKALKNGEFISPYQFEAMSNIRLVFGNHCNWRIAQDENGQWWKKGAV